jgi:hypothetical protein
MKNKLYHKGYIPEAVILKAYKRAKTKFSTLNT